MFLWKKYFIVITPHDNYSYDVSFINSLSDFSMSHSKIIFLNDNFYTLTLDGKIVKYNPITKEMKEINVDLWEVNEFDIDNFNHIIVKGKDYNFNDYNGYLNENDELVGTLVENNGFVNYILNPIN